MPEGCLAQCEEKNRGVGDVRGRFDELEAMIFAGQMVHLNVTRWTRLGLHLTHPRESMSVYHPFSIFLGDYMVDAGHRPPVRPPGAFQDPEEAVVLFLQISKACSEEARPRHALFFSAI